MAAPQQPATGANHEKGYLLTALLTASLLVAGAARADTFGTAVGGGIGAIAGAVIGDSMGGRSGAIVGSGVGGAMGPWSGSGYRKPAPVAYYDDGRNFPPHHRHSHLSPSS